MAFHITRCPMQSQWGAASVLRLIRPPPPRCGGTAPWSALAVFKLMPTLKPADRDLPKNGER